MSVLQIQVTQFYKLGGGVNMKKKYIATMAMSLLIAGTLSNSVHADMDQFLTKTTSGYFTYSYNDLIKSSINAALGKSAPLFERFQAEQLVGFHDSVNGYVSAEAVNKAAVKAVMGGTDFSLNAFIGSASSDNILTGITGTQNLTEQNGSVVSGGSSTTTVVGTVEKITVAPQPGQTIVIVSLPAGTDASKYTVTVAGIALTYDTTTGKFAGVVTKSYSTASEAQADLSVKLIESGTQDGDFDVVDIS